MISGLPNYRWLRLPGARHPEPRQSGEFAEKMAKTVAERMTPDNIAQIERQGESTPPEESYLAAKADAEQMLEAIAA